ncbi:DnaD domain protein [Rossellomorea vietnamensis]|uniref:DnaD domain protein n=1 Tax=Rossellomorea vietnamensis TaxID=218284 RepID=UPI00068B258E|nr:DnaD domain protein [Rossellomorea vietnamensis]
MQKNYYAIIPANVRYDNDLTPNAKLLYGEITALCNERGYCWAGNSYFSDLYKKDKSTIKRWIKQLEDKGYITREVKYKEGGFEIEARWIQLCTGGEVKNTPTPSVKNEPDNNTSFNTTSFNTTSNITTTNTAFQFYEQNFGMMSPHIIEDMNAWVEDFNEQEEIIIQALKIAIDRNKRNWGYTKAILKDWHSKGVKTLSDIEALDNENKAKGSVRNEVVQGSGDQYSNLF